MSFPAFNSDLLINDYNYYKRKAFKSYKEGSLKESLKCISYCGSVAWFAPINTQYCDIELETLIQKISKRKKTDNASLGKKENRIVFYNSQLIDSGALTEQYLNYFIQNKFEVLFIVPDIKSTLLGSGILKRIEQISLITLFVPTFKDKLEKIHAIENEINRFGAQRAFLHFTPADVVGFASFCNLSEITRYFIVHNDHTFWFGQNCSDYFIEFRKFGYRLAIERRGIEPSKIYHLPFYPIKQTIPFNGFPVDVEGKIIGFSGANLYKYYFDPELRYFKAIKQLLHQNPDFIFFLAGYGDSAIVEEFIEANNLQNRFIFLGKRNDFYELVRKIDILFESYPFKGGLTVLYGVDNHKAITGIGEDRNASGSLEDFFDLTTYQQPQNFEDFINEADMLIKSKSAREANAAKFKNIKYTRTDFEIGLTSILKGEYPNEHPIYKESLKLSDEYYLNEYLKLPGSEFEFYYRKFFELKSLIPFKNRISIIFKLYSLKPNVVKRRILRYVILTLFGK